MTRTVFLGEPTRRVRSLYSAVYRALGQAQDAARVGARAAEVDGAARRALARFGLDRYFIHSTGHGVGLEIHERPRLGRGELARLVGGWVMSVEPGVYIEGYGGIRLEDTLRVAPEGTEILTPASKERWIIT